MREDPPRELVDLLQRLGLATQQQVAAVGPRVRRLAKDLPRFESIWIDALAQARVLTPLQTAELHAGRADSLRVGPYVLRSRLPSPGYAELYLAQDVESGVAARLAVCTPSEERLDEVASQLNALVASVSAVELTSLLVFKQAGVDGRRVWAASHCGPTATVADRLVRRGRFHPEAVLESARQMLVGLAGLEAMGICHGDISAKAVGIARDGTVRLSHGGLRGIAHPYEGFDQADLPPSDYDYLAPERVLDGSPPDVASDLYASGCLWWQMLTGRPPIPGGSSLGKLRAAADPSIQDVRQLAPDTAPVLAEAINACLEREPKKRPESFVELTAALGEPTRTGRSVLARTVRIPVGGRSRWRAPLRTARRSLRKPLWLGGAVACVLGLVALVWSVRQDDPAELNNDNARVAGVEQSEPPESTPPGARSARPQIPIVAPPIKQPLPPNVTPRPPADLVLPFHVPIDGRSIRLQPNLVVRAAPGQRATVVVPTEGLLVDVMDVRFENIDFVTAPDTESRPGAGGSMPAVIALQTGRVEFRGCVFRADSAGRDVPIIRWMHPVAEQSLAIPNGRLSLIDSVIVAGETVVACETPGAIAIRFFNVLHLGTGPMVRLARFPAVDEPVGIQMSNVTLRDAGPVLECAVADVTPSAGGISVRAEQCALVPRPEASLLSFVGPGFSESLLQGLNWSGQGSIVSPEGPIVTWRKPDGSLEILDDASLSIAGLVRGEVEFSGRASEGPEANRIEHWQVPLRSASPPGVVPENLPPFATRF